MSIGWFFNSLVRMGGRAFLQAIMQSDSASGSRSTALQSTAWLVGILVAGLVSLVSFAHPPEWAVYCLGGLTAIAVLTFLGLNIFFAIKDPNALRSERFNLQKMAIEKNLIGDNIAGLISTEAMPEVQNPAMLPDAKTPMIDGDNES